VAEITGIAETIAAQTFAPYEVFLAAPAIHLVLAWMCQRCLRRFERWVSWRD
jgi:octopine/nopaline transport system permease protein